MTHANRPNEIDALALAAIGATMILMLTGCGTVRYGDGRVGEIPLKPAVEALAVKADAYGLGDELRTYFADAERERVPDGYRVVVPLLYKGEEMDLSQVTRGEPRLVKQTLPEVVQEAQEAIDAALDIVTQDNPLERLP